MKKSDGVFSEFDRACMKRAFTLARRGEGKTSPNPLVGAVIARGGIIIGEGWHKRCGGLHAEAEAFEAALRAGENPAGADLYCTLEPCCFTSPEKRQPPCAQSIIKNRIRRVVIANIDPHPMVSGKGVLLLKKAGITVQSGLFAEEGEELNRAFFTFQRLGRPFVHLKIAQTLDGKIAASGSAKKGKNTNWITDEAARKIVHKLRARYDAVLVGRGTVLADDPELTVRLSRGRNPVRVVLDSRLKLSLSAKLLHLPDPEKTLIVCGAGASLKKIAAIKKTGANVLPLKIPRKAKGGPGLPIAAVLSALAERGIRSVLVEGGEKIFSSFLREGLWDRLSVFIAPLILGGGVPCVSGLGIGSLAGALRPGGVKIQKIGNQILFEGKNVYRNR
ncbi:MAG: bifunctional diaminohydroxyphosphoribosylaminopyrimidine deaminase/5-amino-6-(5-phosphoribosylamino)uracil reductase RibD [Spirochaetales bacterium]|nr:bifunctional diaminohydroxyphosphoribosylaminopyrimidine deaminase/5-amino-6-(5-phosphoribosylamino)uracil reductase RibD [Spirochaetales bacterium]